MNLEIISSVPRVRHATRLWRERVRRWKVACPERPAARSAAREGANREWSHSREVEGPMPPRVVKTMGRKVRPRRMQPERCLPSFSRARARKIAGAEEAAAEE